MINFTDKKDFKIKILNTTWNVEFVEPKSPSLDANWGMCNYNINTIFVANDLNDENTKSVVYHEFVHAMLAESSFNQDIKDATGKFYENFVECFSKCLQNFDERINNKED